MKELTPVKFGAHEVMEVSEILSEKLNMINHMALYEQEAQDEQLRSTIRRQMDAAIAAYDQMVAYTHDYSARQGMQPPYPQPNSSLERVKYGLRNPQPMAPQRTGRFDDNMISIALLTVHKASATFHIQRGLEVTDPSLRTMFLNGAITCYNQAYEIFLLMNQQGTYQVPTIHDHTAKTMLHSFLPMNNQSLMAEEGMSAAQMQGMQGMQGAMQGMQGMQAGAPSQGQRMQGQGAQAGMYASGANGAGAGNQALQTPHMNGHYMNQ